MASCSASETKLKTEKVAVIGSGLIGRSFAMLFAAGGYKVSLYDIEPAQVSAAMEDIKVQLQDLKHVGLLRGTLDIEQQFALISATNDFKQCVAGAMYVQECVPELVELKEKVFGQLDAVASDAMILASSTSALPASTFSENMKHRAQVIVVHPTNPPFYCPLVEVCPTPWTRPEVRDSTMTILKEIGEVPVLIKKEVSGFVLNRLQYALMNECWRLVQDDVISVEDMNVAMKDGLGTRYAFVGPLEACHLNAEGMQNYCDRYGETIYEITNNFGPIPYWDGPTKDKINDAMCARIPEDKLVERRRWRDARLSALAKLKKMMAASKE